MSKATPTEDPRCGTGAGYQAHRKRGEESCAPCKAAVAARVNAYRLAHPEIIKERKKRYYDANAKTCSAKVVQWQRDNPEKYAIKQRRHYLKHRERLIADRLAAYYADKDAWRARARRSYAKYDSAREKNRRRRALKLAVATEPYTTQQILDAHGTDCYLCLEPIDLTAERKVGREGWERGLHLDHSTPLTRGGPDLIGNVLPTHGACNMAKGDMTPGEFWESLSADSVAVAS